MSCDAFKREMLAKLSKVQPKISADGKGWRNFLESRMKGFNVITPEMISLKDEITKEELKKDYLIELRNVINEATVSRIKKMHQLVEKVKEEELKCGRQEKAMLWEMLEEGDASDIDGRATGSENTLTELLFVIDESSSMRFMETIVSDCDNILADHREMPGDVIVSTVFFSSTIRPAHDRLSIQNVPQITEEDYTLEGGYTALFDAIGRAVYHVLMSQKQTEVEHRPSRTILVIMTDGWDTCSNIYSCREIQRLLKHLQAKRNWVVYCLGTEVKHFRKMDRRDELEFMRRQRQLERMRRWRQLERMRRWRLRSFSE